MRVLLAAVLIAATTAPAFARPDARSMTCEQARNLVFDSGAVVMSTGRYTYQRFVSDGRYCDYWERTRTARAPTRDDPQCRVGYICEDRPERFRLDRHDRR